MLPTYYLSSHDYVHSPAPRLCVFVSDGVIKQTQQRAVEFSISPPLPPDVVGVMHNVDRVLLGFVDPQVKLEEIGAGPFFVDIYTFANRQDRRVSEFCPAELNRVGVGLLHATMEEALKASPLYD